MEQKRTFEDLVGQEERLNERWRWGWTFIAILLGILAPLLITSMYWRGILVWILIYMILSSSYNLIVGCTGYLSFAHASFFGIGAYTSAVMNVNYGYPYWVGFFAALLIAGIAACFIGAVTYLRVKGFYFAITTLGLTMSLYFLMMNLWIDFLRGPMGIPGISHPHFSISGIGNIMIDSQVQFYYFYLIFTALTLFILDRFIHSRIGRSLMAIKGNERLAEAIGIHAFKYKLISFTVGGLFAGMAGNFYAHYVSFISPDLFWLYWMMTPLVIVLLGGLGSPTGVMISSIVLTVIPEFLRAVQGFRELFWGVVVILTVYFLPDGIGGQMNKWMHNWRKRRWLSSLLEK